MKKVLARFVRVSPAMVVAMIALLVALGGVSTAAQITSPQASEAKKKPKVLRGPRGKRGPRGLRGPVGAAGQQGAQGIQGIQGIQGPPGVPNPNAVNSDLLDGKDSSAFAASVLAGGQLLSGSYAAWGGTSGYLADNVQFRIPLSTDIAAANTHFISDTSAFTANCPGHGQAVAGHLCVYERTHGGRSFGSIHQSEGGITPGAGENGFWIWFSAGAGGSWSYGEWAVRAPNSAAAAATRDSQAAAEAPPGR